MTEHEMKVVLSSEMKWKHYFHFHDTVTWQNSQVLAV